MQQIQLPQGMKDTILNECEKKKYLQNTLERIFESLDMKKSLHQRLSIMKHMKMHLKTFKQQICINSLMKMEEF